MKQKRTKRFEVRLSESEHENIKRIADFFKFKTITEYVRAIAQYPIGCVQDKERGREIINEIINDKD